MGNKSGPAIAYCASKTLAEKGDFLNILSFGLPLTCFLQSAAWDFYEEHKPRIKWDLVVIIPPPVKFFFFLLYTSIVNSRITGVRGEKWFPLNRRTP